MKKLIIATLAATIAAGSAMAWSNHDITIDNNALYSISYKYDELNHNGTTTKHEAHAQGLSNTVLREAVGEIKWKVDCEGYGWNTADSAEIHNIAAYGTCFNVDVYVN